MNSPDQLHVICVISNPVRFASRYRRAREFIEDMQRCGVHLIVVEHAFADRPFEVTSPHNPDHVQLRGREGYEIWLKESLINVGLRHLTATKPGWEKAAWIDADIHFARPNWVAETLFALDHHAVVQPWSYAIDLGPYYEPMVNEWGNDVDRSFCAAFMSGRLEASEGYQPVPRPLRNAEDWRHHAGYAWAIRREVWEAIGGLIDWMVTGSADYYMARAFCGILDEQLVKDADAGMAPGWLERLRRFQARCDAVVRKNVGFVPGLIEHGFHGYKGARGYLTQKDILAATRFDPEQDLVADPHGVWRLAGNKPELEQAIRAWFRQRNEDADLALA